MQWPKDGMNHWIWYTNLVLFFVGGGGGWRLLPNSFHCRLNASWAPASRKVCWDIYNVLKRVRWFHIKTFGQLTISWPWLQQKWSSQTRGSKCSIFFCWFLGAIYVICQIFHILYYLPWFFFFFFFCNWAYSTTINLVK